MYHLVPDLLKVLNSQFYWGKLSKDEAKKLLKNKPDGTFIVTDSATRERVFTLSYRKFGKTFHIQMLNLMHILKLDLTSFDPILSTSVCTLIEYYQNKLDIAPFDPLLTTPLCRNFVFPLQNLCRGTICSNFEYHDIDKFNLPTLLKLYLKEYYSKVRI